MLPGRRFRWMGGMLRGEQKTEDRGQTAGDRNRPLFCRSQAPLGNASPRSSASHSLTPLLIPDSPPRSGFAKQSLAGRIPKQSLGTTESCGELKNWRICVCDTIAPTH